MKNQQGKAITALVIYVLIVVTGLIGWVMNIVAIVHAGFADFNGMLIARCIGVFVAPLGAVLGYC